MRQTLVVFMAGFGRVTERVTGIYIRVCRVQCNNKGCGWVGIFGVYNSANLQEYTVMNRGMSSTLC